MVTNPISKSQKLSLEWVILILTTLSNIGIILAGILLLSDININFGAGGLVLDLGDIFDQIFGVLMIILFFCILLIMYQFYSENPWGWFFNLLFQSSLLIAAIFVSYNQTLLDFLDDFYLVVVKGFARVLIDSIGGATNYDLDRWLEDIIFNETSFIERYSILMGFLLSLIGIYWSIQYLSIKHLSDIERRSFIRKSLICLLLAFLIGFLGIFLYLENDSLNGFIGAVLGSLGSILLLVIMHVTLSEDQKEYLRLILFWGTIVAIAVKLYDIFSSFVTLDFSVDKIEFRKNRLFIDTTSIDPILVVIIIIATIAIMALRSQTIRDKYDVLGTAEQREEQTALILILPTAAVVVTIVLVPVIWVVVASFYNVGLTNIGPDAERVSFQATENYMKFLDDDEFYTAVTTSILYTVLGTVGSVFVGLVVAILLNRAFPGRGVVRSIMLFPYIASTVALVVLWTWGVHGVYGVLNFLLMDLGIIDKPEAWLDKQPYAFIIIVVFEIWKYFPFAMLMILARLQAISQELYEAADIDGANEWQKMRHITLPELKYVLGVVVLLRTIWTFNKFDDVFLFTAGTVETGTLVVPIYIFDKIWSGVLFKVSEAAAVSVFLVIGLLAFSITFGKKVLHW